MTRMWVRKSDPHWNSAWWWCNGFLPSIILTPRKPHWKFETKIFLKSSENAGVLRWTDLMNSLVRADLPEISGKSALRRDFIKSVHNPDYVGRQRGVKCRTRALAGDRRSLRKSRRCGVWKWSTVRWKGLVLNLIGIVSRRSQFRFLVSKNQLTEARISRSQSAQNGVPSSWPIDTGRKSGLWASQRCSNSLGFWSWVEISSIWCAEKPDLEPEMEILPPFSFILAR